MRYKGKISELKSIQIIFVDTKKQALMLYKKTKHKWKKIMYTKAYLGRNGVTKDKKEGDGKTPLGIYRLGPAFGLCENIQTKLDYIQLDNCLYWVDDCDSKYYNKLVDIKKVQKDWISAEHLIEFQKQYEYSVVIAYNTKCIKGKGSAIFLHCSVEKPTSGCIAIQKEKMLELLNLLEKHSIILID